jgi:AcrR family transcriptional regulator
MEVSLVSDRPTRAERHAATLRRIVDAAWRLSAERGLGGWTMRDLGGAVGMRAPSLYGYASSKNDLFDLMFADGNRALLDRADDLPRTGDPVADLRGAAHLFLSFAAESPARFQLLFQHAVPGFSPSPESMALAAEVLDRTARTLADAGRTEAAELDLWTAVLTGLASQQVANDPGGRRWAGLVDEAVGRFVGAGGRGAPPSAGEDGDDPRQAAGVVVQPGDDVRARVRGDGDQGHGVVPHPGPPVLDESAEGPLVDPAEGRVEPVRRR